MVRIRELRKEQGVSQVQLARKARMDPATLNRIEQDKGNPNLKTLGRIADALEIGVAELLTEPQAPKGPAPEPSPNGSGAGHSYPFPWMADTLARVIDGWSKQVEVPPANPMISYAISIGAVDVLQEILRFDVPGETLRDRVPVSEVEERVRLANRVDRVLTRANAHYAASKDADPAEVRSLEDHRAEIRRRTEEIKESA